MDRSCQSQGLSVLSLFRLAANTFHKIRRLTFMYFMSKMKSNIAVWRRYESNH